MTLGGRELGLRRSELPLRCRNSSGEGLEVVSQLLSDVRRSGGGYDGVKVVVEFGVRTRTGLVVAYERVVPSILNYNRVKGS